MLVFVALLSAAYCIALPENEAVDYTGYKTLRVPLNSKQDIDMMKEWAEAETVDILNEGIGNEVDILVSPYIYPAVVHTLEKAEIKYEILVEDVAADIEEERAQLLKAVPGVFDFKNYYATRYQHAHLDALAAKHSDKAETFSIGKSYEGRDMKAIRISNNLASSGNKPMIWVDGGIHAREWISSHTALYMANALLGEIDPSLQSQVSVLLNKYQFVFLPMSNPDGYEYSRTSNRYWRKTRRPSGCKYGRESNGRCTYGRCYGIDPNRNWDADFGRKGVSSNPCSDVYPGKKAFSESNTKAMSDYIKKNLSKIKLYLSFHSYSQLFLKPIGFEYTKPRDYRTHDRAGAAAVNAIRQSHGKTYRNIRSVELYPTSGSSQDWAYLQGIVNAYTIELRDTGRYGFKLPTNQIIPTGEENMRGFIALINTL